jgi:hypothetical protein
VAINCSQHILVYYVRELFYGAINYEKFRIWNQCIPVEWTCFPIPILITSRPIILKFIDQNIPKI